MLIGAIVRENEEQNKGGDIFRGILLTFYETIFKLFMGPTEGVL
jgi:hypothetical protein